VRIASLVPAGTEIAWALGLTERLVAVTHDCDFPPEIASLPRLTASTIPTGSTSAEIDHLVRTAGERGESTFHVDAAALHDARPDVILGQTICRVCAVTLDQLPAEIGSTPRTIPLTAGSLDGMFEDVRRVGTELGVSEGAERVVAELRARLEAVSARVADRARPRVACLEWLDPIFPGGHWVPEQVERAGGVDAVWQAGRPGAAVPWERIAASAPDVLVLMPCGWDTARALDAATAVTSRPGFADLPAARSGRVFATDGGAYFSRPGPRLVDGVEILAAILHPDVFAAPDPRDATRLRIPSAAGSRS
jgi:iron complex transport system substrate-binding protein